MQNARLVLVLDFDGTICLGDGPIWAYANAVLAGVDAEVAERVGAALRRYLAGNAGDGDFADGYAALAELAGPHVTGGVLEEGYAHSRLALEDAAVDIEAPEGLADLLDEVAGPVRRVVVTNAPDTGLATAMRRLGLDGRIDEIVASAGKPAGSRVVLARLLAGAPAENLMSVGDIWRNDIAPALELGAATGFVDRFGRSPHPAHACGRNIQQLYPAIREWATAPAAFTATHRPALCAVPSDS